MTEDQRELFEKAHQSLHAARLLLSGGHAQQFLDLAQRLIGPFDDRAATED